MADAVESVIRSGVGVDYGGNRPDAADDSEVPA